MNFKKLADFKNKKDLKNYVNKNGFYTKVVGNRITRDQLVSDYLSIEDKTQFIDEASVPEGDHIIILHTLTSQNYGLGEKNRNGYKIDTRGWSMEDYALNSVVLHQHSPSYGPIGNTIMYYWDAEDNLCSVLYVNLNTVEPRVAEQIRTNLLKGISTGGLVEEMMIEDNDDGTRYTFEEAKEEGIDIWSVLWGQADGFTLVMTRCLMLEQSLVTIGSNAKALAANDAFGGFIQDNIDELCERFGIEKPESVTDEVKDEQDVPVEADDNVEEGEATPSEEEKEVEDDVDESELVNESEEVEESADEVVEDNADETDDQPADTDGGEPENDDGDVTDEQKEDDIAPENGDDAENASDETTDNVELTIADQLKQLTTDELVQKVITLQDELKTAKDTLEETEGKAVKAINDLLDQNSKFQTLLDKASKLTIQQGMSDNAPVINNGLMDAIKTAKSQ